MADAEGADLLTSSKRNAVRDTWKGAATMGGFLLCESHLSGGSGECREGIVANLLPACYVARAADKDCYDAVPLVYKKVGLSGWQAQCIQRK